MSAIKFSMKWNKIWRFNRCRYEVKIFNWICDSSKKFSSGPGVKKTCLYDFHVKKNAKIIDFAGFQMPLQYAGHSISSSHMHTRQHVSIFDVSHMLQSIISGKDRISFMESLTVSDLQGLKTNQGTLTLYTNENGGIIDDLIVTKTDCDYLYVVSNAGCIEKDLQHVQSRLKDFQKNNEVELKVLNDRALLAIQGPGMVNILGPLVSCDLKKLGFMTSTIASVCDIPDCRITRCGYTGEDGVEISLPSTKASVLIETLLASKYDDVRLAGLAARDTLRLEAGLCLYGNDITEETTPVEAGLAWTISKRRRSEGGFPGADFILKQLKNKPSVKRVGLLSVGPSARAHTPILDNDGKKIGEVTSGCPSPCLRKNIAMGYVSMEFAKIGTNVNFEIRKKIIPATVMKMPFVPTKYYIE